MRRETGKWLAQSTMGALIVWTSTCFFVGLCAVASAKSTLNYDYIFIVLLTGILSGMLAILAYLSWRIGGE